MGKIILKQKHKISLLSLEGFFLSFHQRYCSKLPKDDRGPKKSN